MQDIAPVRLPAGVNAEHDQFVVVIIHQRPDAVVADHLVAAGVAAALQLAVTLGDDEAAAILPQHDVAHGDLVDARVFFIVTFALYVLDQGQGEGRKIRPRGGGVLGVDA